MLRAGMGGGGGGGDPRLKGQLSFSSRQGSVMSQISEMGSEDEELAGGGGSPEAGSNGGGAARGGYGGGYAMGSSAWEEPSPPATSLLPDSSLPSKRPRDDLPRQLSLPAASKSSSKPPSSASAAASPEMAAIEKFLQFQDAVPCKIRAKRGCATHPRSIAERVRTVPYTRAHLSPPRARHGMAWRGVARDPFPSIPELKIVSRLQVRRTRISERIRKLQELVPNMEKVRGIPLVEHLVCYTP